MNLQKLKPNKNFISSVLIAIAIGLFVSVVFVLADWTAPPATPPTCPSSDAACNTPINVSSFGQTKSGALLVGSLGVSGALRGYSDARFDGDVSIGTAVYKAGNQYAYALTLPNTNSYYEGAGIAYKWDTYPGGSLCIAGVCKTSWPTGITLPTCSNGQVLKWNSGTWGCGTDIDTDTKGLHGVVYNHTICTTGKQCNSVCQSGTVLLGGGCYHINNSALLRWSYYQTFAEGDGWSCTYNVDSTASQYAITYTICATP